MRPATIGARSRTDSVATNKSCWFARRKATAERGCFPVAMCLQQLHQREETEADNAGEAADAVQDADVIRLCKRRAEPPVGFGEADERGIAGNARPSAPNTTVRRDRSASRMPAPVASCTNTNVQAQAEASGAVKVRQSNRGNRPACGERFQLALSFRNREDERMKISAASSRAIAAASNAATTRAAGGRRSQHRPDDGRRR